MMKYIAIILGLAAAALAQQPVIDYLALAAGNYSKPVLYNDPANPYNRQLVWSGNRNRMNPPDWRHANEG